MNKNKSTTEGKSKTDTETKDSSRDKTGFKPPKNNNKSKGSSAAKPLPVKNESNNVNKFNQTNPVIKEDIKEIDTTNNFQELKNVETIGGQDEKYSVTKDDKIDGHLEHHLSNLHNYLEVDSDDNFFECGDGDENWGRDEFVDMIDLIRSDDLESLKEGFEHFGPTKSAELCVGSDKRGLSSLTLAAELNRLEAVKLMLEQKPNIDVPNAVGGWTALHCASSQAHVDMVKLLVEAGAGLEIGDREGWTALHFSSDRGCLEAIQILVKSGANINAFTTAEHFTALYLACQAGHVDVVEWLLGQGSIIEEKDKDGWTPLHAACNKNHLEIVRLLVNDTKAGNSKENIRFVNTKAVDGITALYLAAQHGYAELVEILLNNGAEVNLLEDEGFAPLHVACQGGHYDVVVAILKSSDSNINLAAKTETAWCPIHFATQENHVAVVELLIEKSAKVDITTADGHTPLHLASGNGDLECVKVLIQKGQADPSITDRLGWCPLHHAAQNGHRDVVEELLGLQQSCNEGSDHQLLEDPLGVIKAGSEKKNHLTKLIDLETKDGDTSLLIAVLNNHAPVVEMLIQNGACLNKEEEEDNSVNELSTKEYHNISSVLHAACEVGGASLISLLVAHGAKVNAKDGKGWTPLHCLAETDKIDCIDALILNSSSSYSDKTNIFLHEKVRENSGAANNEPTMTPTTPEEYDEDLTPSPVFPSPYLSQVSNQKDTSEIETVMSNSLIDGHQSGNKPDLNAQTTYGHTPLILAAHSGQANTVAHLLKLGANAGIVDYLGWTALHAASANGHTGVIKTLLSFSGLDVNRRTYHGFTALYLAVQDKHSETAEYLLNEALANPNLSENQGFCPLHVASQNGFARIIESLMNSGALGNKIDSNGWTALHFAVQDGSLETVKKLVLHGSDVDARTKDGVTPLFIAVHKNADEIIEFLLQHGARTDLSETATGLTPLHVACDNGRLKAVQRLLSAGSNVEAETKYDQLRPLYMAARSTCTTDESVVETIARALLSESADPMPPTTSGLSALHIAAQRGMTGLVQALVEHGAMVDEVDEAGWTPLMFASRYGQSKTVRALLAAGAKPDNPKGDHKNIEKVDALLLAVQNGHILAVEALILWSCNINSTTCDGTTALYCASQHGDLEMIQMLLFNGADPNLQDKRGFIPLHPACLNGHKKVVDSLVKAGSGVDHAAKDGTRPVQLADRNGHEEITAWLVIEGAKSPDYEEKFGFGWGSGLVSGWGAYFKNVLVKAYKHGLEEYKHLSGEDDESGSGTESKDARSKSETLKREATVEKINLAGSSRSSERRGRQKFVVAGTARQVHKV